jgi:hypothetical protein
MLIKQFRPISVLLNYFLKICADFAQKVTNNTFSFCKLSGEYYDYMTPTNIFERFIRQMKPHDFSSIENYLMIIQESAVETHECCLRAGTCLNMELLQHGAAARA